MFDMISHEVGFRNTTRKPGSSVDDASTYVTVVRRFMHPGPSLDPDPCRTPVPRTRVCAYRPRICSMPTGICNCATLSLVTVAGCHHWHLTPGYDSVALCALNARPHLCRPTRVHPMTRDCTGTSLRAGPSAVYSCTATSEARPHLLVGLPCSLLGNMRPFPSLELTGSLNQEPQT